MVPNLVSVIIPTRNRAAMVRQAVESVLAQKDASLEVIVVDDGSTDDTAHVLTAYSARIQVIRREHSGGVSAARNAGIVASRGEWIAFLDSDDMWLPQKVSAQLEYFRTYTGMRICQTEEIWIHRGRRRNPKKYHTKPSGWCFERLLERCLVSPSAVMMHRSLLEEVGLFDESLPACEDYDMWLRIGCRYPIGLVPRALVVKRGGHDDQLSATIPALDRYRLKAMAKLLHSAPLTPMQRDQTLKVLKRKASIYAGGCLKRGKQDEAVRVLTWLRETLLENGNR
ncbi:glycosyltransferase family 2 protein [Desulfosoma caldarium]|uniref:Glycosyltransferase involved in cell wall biosynthesis n=1 Tax=Desulfosoma caldarium TaxID=610254 RepID=A0A3N1VQ82_9BACT|nr:glycosyltransferase [Desulfosoma caldarium]ROR03221.1 glycosyltransferase involved in cell wall biosynthesis [Desulfosoma caldarium]